MCSVSSPRMETLQVARRDGIVTITLDRPAKKNAANNQMWDDLLATLREIGDTASDRVVVITGAGGEFCSGADLSSLGGDRHQLAAMRHVGDVALTLHRLPQPTIAKVRGVAVGAGCNLALGCDLVVASENARFSEIFSKRGLSLDFGGSWLLPRRVGLHKAKELALFADIISAADAEAIGLVNRVLPDAELDAFYATFLRIVAEGRNRPVDAIAELAQGRVWTGRAARANGLVDETGGFEQALALADEFAAHIDVTNMRTHGERRKQAPFNKKMRIIAHDLAVFAGAGL